MFVGNSYPIRISAMGRNQAWKIQDDGLYISSTNIFGKPLIITVITAKFQRLYNFSVRGPNI